MATDPVSIQQDVIAQVNTTYSSAMFGLQLQGVAQNSQTGINFQQLGKYINDWATRRAGWALNGRRDDGSAYGLERWTTEGQGYAKDASDYANMAYDDSTFAVALETIKNIPGYLPEDLSNAAHMVTSPTAWPWYVQVGVGVVGLYYASQIWANFKGKK